MNDINSVIVIGNLTRDCELKYMQNGTAIGTFSIAVNQSYTSNGQKVENVYYFDVSIFGKMAETLNQYLKKGKKVAVGGHLKQDRWKDHQGNNRSKVSIVADTLELLSPMQNNGNQSQYAQQYQQQNTGAFQQNAGAVQQNNQQGFQEDIPWTSDLF